MKRVEIVYKCNTKGLPQYDGKEFTIIKEFKDDIKGDLKIVKNISREHDKDISMLKSRKFIESHSPAQLNKEGQRVFKESGIEKIITDNLDNLFKLIIDKNPKNPYDVQEYAKEIIKVLKESNLEILKKGVS